jgi:hypothetical protein
VIISDKNIESPGIDEGAKGLHTYNPLLFFRGAPYSSKRITTLMHLISVVF